MYDICYRGLYHHLLILNTNTMCITLKSICLMLTVNKQIFEKQMSRSLNVVYSFSLIKQVYHL